MPNKLAFSVLKKSPTYTIFLVTTSRYATARVWLLNWLQKKSAGWWKNKKQLQTSPHRRTWIVIRSFPAATVAKHFMMSSDYIAYELLGVVHHAKVLVLSIFSLPLWPCDSCAWRMFPEHLLLLAPFSWQWNDALKECSWQPRNCKHEFHQLLHESCLKDASNKERNKTFEIKHYN